MPDLVNQQTVQAENGDKIESWTIRIPAVNRIVARQRSRAFARRLDPAIKNILNPKVITERTRQTTFSELFPESIQRKDYEVELLVVR